MMMDSWPRRFRSTILLLLIVVLVSSIYYLSFPTGTTSRKGRLDVDDTRPQGGDNGVFGEEDVEAEEEAEKEETVERPEAEQTTEEEEQETEEKVAEEGKEGDEGPVEQKNGACSATSPKYLQHDSSVDKSGKLVHGPCHRSRVKVMTSCDPGAAHRDVSIKNKMLYAKLHGYDFEWWVTAYKAPQGQTPRPPIWTKTAFLLDVLAGTEGERVCDYDWLLWLDCDSLVARYEFTIKHITGQYFNDQHKQIVLSKDLNGFNSGIMALRCSAWNLALFRRIWDSKQYINDVWAEQRGLIAFYNSDSDVKSRVAEVPQDQMQYVKGAPARQVPEGAAGEFDIFVVHFAGFWDAKDKWMAQYYPDIMKHGSWMQPPLD